MSLSKLFDRFDEAIGRGDSASTLRILLATIREQIEAKLEDTKLQLENAESRVQELKVKLKGQKITGQPEEPEKAAKQILVLIFKDEDASLELMARHLGISDGLARYHANQLEDLGLIELSSAGPSGTLYSLTRKGRAYVVENKLAE